MIFHCAFTNVGIHHDLIVFTFLISHFANIRYMITKRWTRALSRQRFHTKRSPALFTKTISDAVVCLPSVLSSCSKNDSRCDKPQGSKECYKSICCSFFYAGFSTLVLVKLRHILSYIGNDYDFSVSFTPTTDTWTYLRFLFYGHENQNTGSGSS